MQFRVFLIFIFSFALLACKSQNDACCALLPPQKNNDAATVIGIKGDTEKSVIYGSVGYEAKVNN